MGKIQKLECCCCGGGARGRQWHNRDTGYGLCDNCADWLIEKGVSEAEMVECYGILGTHYKVNPEQETAP